MAISDFRISRVSEDATIEADVLSLDSEVVTLKEAHHAILAQLELFELSIHVTGATNTQVSHRLSIIMRVVANLWKKSGAAKSLCCFLSPSPENKPGLAG